MAAENSGKRPRATGVVSTKYYNGVALYVDENVAEGATFERKSP